MKTSDMEIYLMLWFGTRSNLIVPNVSWGMFNHECDLIVMTPAGYISEVEIKISLGDLKADKLKSHCHEDCKISKLYFAIPKNLYKHKEHIPEKAGIITVDETGYCTLEKTPYKNKNRYAATITDRYTLARLGAMRILTLKCTIRRN